MLMKDKNVFNLSSGDSAPGGASGQITSDNILGVGQFYEPCRQFYDRMVALHLIRQINHLCKAIQQHRGFGLALLAGEIKFRTEFDLLQGEIRRRIIALEAFVKQSRNLLSDNDLEKIHHAWATIECDWQNDAVMENFELHSFFIEQLLALMIQLAKHLERPVVDVLTEYSSDELKGDTPLAKRRALHQVGLLVFVCNQMPEMVEQLAKIRGLATHAASAGMSDDLHDSKIRYLVQCTQLQYGKVKNQAERLKDIVDGGIASLTAVKDYEFKLNFLLNTIEKEILAHDNIRMDSRHIFELATEIIDKFLSVVDEGVGLLQRWLDDGLEEWLIQPAK